VSDPESPRYRIHPLCAWRRIEDRVFVLNDRDAFVTLDDPVGLVVWQVLEQRPCSLDELVEAVAARFDVAVEEARRDLVEFLEALLAGRAIDAA